MNEINLSPTDYADDYTTDYYDDDHSIDKLHQERERILAQKTRLGRLATKAAAFFYCGDLAFNRLQTNRLRRAKNARNFSD